MKGARISERKFREILKLFCADLTAMQIAEITKIERKAANRVLQHLRRKNLVLAAEKQRLAKVILELVPSQQNRFA